MIGGAILRLYAVRCSTSNVRECTSGSRELWSAQYVGAAKVSCNTTRPEQRKGQIADADAATSITSHGGRSRVCVKPPFRAMLQSDAVPNVSGDRA
jgi:hypothetical protein